MLGEELAMIVRCGVADGVRQVDRRAAGGDDRFDDAAQEIAIAPCRILRRKLHIVGKAAGEGDGVDRRFEALVARHAQLARQVQVGGGEKRVNARPLGRRERPRRLFDVLPPGPRQRRDDRPPDRHRDLPHRFRVGRRRDRKSRLDDVDRQARRAPAPSPAFAGTSIEKPGACSPSRSVVSKTMMRAGSMRAGRSCSSCSRRAA